MLRITGRLPRRSLRALVSVAGVAPGQANYALWSNNQIQPASDGQPERLAQPQRSREGGVQRWLDGQMDKLQKRRHVLQRLASGAPKGQEDKEEGRPRTRREYALGLRAEDRYSLDAPSEGVPPTLRTAQFNPQSQLLELIYSPDTAKLSASPLWMRDLCLCSRCVTPSSGQKAVLTHDLDQSPTIRHLAARNAAGEDVPLPINSPDTEAHAEAHAEIASLVITWDDGAPHGSKSGGEHVSVYDAADLLCQLTGLAAPLVPALPRRVLWDRVRIDAMQTPVSYADWMARTADSGGKTPAFYRALTDLHQLGLVVVDGVPDGAETAVRDIAGEIGHVQPTFYGELFDVVSKPTTEAENVAYTNVHLGLHQDLLYMNDPPRIQLLHCLRNDCAGGESLFSDSLRAAVEMQLRYPFYAQALAQFKVPYHYERNGNLYFNERPVLETSATGNQGVASPADMPGLVWRGRTVPPMLYDAPIRHTAWSPPFQGTFPPATLVGEQPATSQGASMPDVAAMSHSEQAQDFQRRYVGRAQRTQLAYWHEAARVFDGLLNSERHLYEFKLQPGQCVLFDNRRVLHGRRHFTFAPEAEASTAGDARPRWLKGTYISDQVFRSRVMGMVRGGLAPADSLPPALAWTPTKAMLEEQVQVLQMLEAAGEPLWTEGGM